MTDISVVKSYQETQHWPTGVRLIVADGNARVALAEDTDRLSVVVYSPRILEPINLSPCMFILTEATALVGSSKGKSDHFGRNLYRYLSSNTTTRVGILECLSLSISKQTTLNKIKIMASHQPMCCLMMKLLEFEGFRYNFNMNALERIMTSPTIDVWFIFFAHMYQHLVWFRPTEYSTTVDRILANVNAMAFLDAGQARFEWNRIADAIDKSIEEIAKPEDKRMAARMTRMRAEPPNGRFYPNDHVTTTFPTWWQHCTENRTKTDVKSFYVVSKHYSDKLLKPLTQTLGDSLRQVESGAGSTSAPDYVAPINSPSMILYRTIAREALAVYSHWDGIYVEFMRDLYRNYIEIESFARDQRVFVGSASQDKKTREQSLIGSPHLISILKDYIPESRVKPHSVWGKALGESRVVLNRRVADGKLLEKRKSDEPIEAYYNRYVVAPPSTATQPRSTVTGKRCSEARSDKSSQGAGRKQIKWSGDNGGRSFKVTVTKTTTKDASERNVKGGGGTSPYVRSSDRTRSTLYPSTSTAARHKHPSLPKPVATAKPPDKQQKPTRTAPGDGSRSNPTAAVPPPPPRPSPLPLPLPPSPPVPSRHLPPHAPPSPPLLAVALASTSTLSEGVHTAATVAADSPMLDTVPKREEREKVFTGAVELDTLFDNAGRIIDVLEGDEVAQRYVLLPMPVDMSPDVEDLYRGLSDHLAELTVEEKGRYLTAYAGMVTVRAGEKRLRDRASSPLEKRT